jgi:hypothetical protein
MDMRPVGAELFQADGKRDTTKLIVAFRNFAKARENVITCMISRALSVVNSRNI